MASKTVGSPAVRPGSLSKRMSSPSRSSRSPATPLTRAGSAAAALEPFDLQTTPARNEIVRLENELKVKDMELTKVLTESKALRQTNVSMEKAVKSLSEDNASLKERLAMAEKIIESKTLELKHANDARRAALTDMAAAEATTRRIQASMKDPGDNGAEEVRMALEAELKLARREISRLQEETKTQDRLMKNKEQALVESERGIAAVRSKAALLNDCENRLRNMEKQLEASQHETATIDKMYRQKVEEVKKLSDKIDELNEALLAAGALQSVVKDYERQLHEGQAEQKTLNEELARTKVAATRVAMAVANEWKDDNDKVIPVKQWLEERRMLQGEMARLKEKLVSAEKAIKYETQMKTKAQSRLKVIEESLKAAGLAKLIPSRAATVRSEQSYTEATSSDGLPSGKALDNDAVSGVLYDTLHKEVVTLRRTVKDHENALSDKEASNDMLLKKVDLLMKAMDVDSRRYRRDVAVLKEEIESLKVELAARGPRRSSASPRTPRS